MGRSDGGALEAPAHAAQVKPFFIDRFEVTNQQYLEFVRATSHPPPPQWANSVPAAGREHHPVTGVSIDDARAFAHWRAAKDKLDYRLPSEAEWEYAARGPNDRRYPWGNEWQKNNANIRGNEGRLSDVGSFTKGATPEGVEDLLGNAAEWADDQLRPYPGGKSALPAANLWVIRGGGYDSNEATATTRWARRRVAAITITSDFVAWFRRRALLRNESFNTIQKVTLQILTWSSWRLIPIIPQLDSFSPSS